MKKKKDLIEEQSVEIEEDIDSEDDYLRSQERLFYQIVEESYKQIIKCIKEGDTYKAQDYVVILNGLNQQEGKKEFNLVMSVLDKLRLK